MHRPLGRQQLNVITKEPNPFCTCERAERSLPRIFVGNSQGIWSQSHCSWKRLNTASPLFLASDALTRSSVLYELGTRRWRKPWELSSGGAHRAGPPPLCSRAGTGVRDALRLTTSWPWPMALGIQEVVAGRVGSPTVCYPPLALSSSTILSPKVVQPSAKVTGQPRKA